MQKGDYLLMIGLSDILMYWIWVRIDQ